MTAASPRPAFGAASPAAPPNATVVTVAVCGSAATMFMAITAVLAGLPDIAEDIDASQRQLQWAADVYPLALATLLLPSGVLADRYGRRRFLGLGLAVLVAGLLLASQARSPAALLVGLGLAGIGSGLGFPSTLATITGAVPLPRRPLAISLWAAAVPVGGLSGAMVTGAFLDLASWPWAFAGTAGLAAAALATVLVAVPETRDARRRRLDVGGALLSAAAVASLVLGLTEGPVAGWGDAATLGWFAASAVLLAAFVAWELRVDEPLLDVRLFAIPAFGTAVLAMFLMFGGLFGLVYLGYQWEAYVLGMRNVLAGLGLAPLAVFMLPLAVTSTRLAGRFGLKPVLAAALAAGAAGAAILAWSGHTERYWTLALGCVVFGACIGLAAGPGTDAISSALPAARQGVASAVNDLSRELGATLGIAVAGTAFNAAYRSSVDGRLDVGRDPVAAAVHASPGAGLRAITEGRVTDTRYGDVLATATSQGWTAGALAVAVAFALGLVLFLLRFPRDAATTNLRDAADREAPADQAPQ